MSNLTDSHGKPFAVVTGASTGIGLELARQFAQHGFDLLIISNSGEIETAAQTLRQYTVNIETCEADLSTAEGVDEAFAAVRFGEWRLDAIALNAGVGAAGPFTETDWQKELNLINLNVVNTTYLAKLVLPEMQRGYVSEEEAHNHWHWYQKEQARKEKLVRDISPALRGGIGASLSLRPKHKTRD